MKFTIVTRFSGRLRVRLGKAVFDSEQGKKISSLFFGISHVEKVFTCTANGSILVLYPPEFQHSVEEAVFSALKTLDLDQLSSEPMGMELVSMQQEQGLKQDVFHLCATRGLTKWFMPTSWVPYYQWWKSLGYLRAGVRALFARKISVDVLDAVAISVSLGRKDYTTASSTMFLLQLSEMLLAYSNARAKNQLARSLHITTQRVWLVATSGDENETQEREVSLDSLVVGDVIRLRKGVMVPVDGTVISGEGLFNEATMTGESLPVHKGVGASIFAGTLMEEGEVDLTVRQLSGNSRIAQVVDLIEKGEHTKAEVQGKAEALADGIVPYSLGLFGLTYLFTGNLTRAVSVLMVDFSCAIKLTTPIAVISALKEAAEMGIVVKGGKYLEILSQVDTIVFDKTGTLTKAVPQVARVISVDAQYSEDDILRIAACLEEHFPHSVAAAIVAEAKKRELHHPENHGKVEYIVAHGVVTTQDGVRYAIGSAHFIFEDEGIFRTPELSERLAEEIGHYSAVYLAIGDTLAGVLCIFDPPRPEAASVVKGLRGLGIKECVMLTGDSESTAAAISKELALDGYQASVLPDGKVALLEYLQSEGKKVLMVGDGVNDAPALSVADVSVTLAESSDIAREVSDISILSHDLRDLLQARILGTGLMGRISGHYGMIVGFNGSLLVLGALGILSASQNALFHNLSTLFFAGLSTRPLLTRGKGLDVTEEGGKSHETA